jgi:UDP-N-acetylmuramyl pentapeptide phosphotransferase/UDP-N-acetylglucosamine-1-phosphate transferase
MVSDGSLIEDPIRSLTVLAVVAFGLSLVVVHAIERVAGRFGLVDHPNPRSSHAAPRPRGGGIGVVVAVTAVAVVMAASGKLSAPVEGVLMASVLLAVVGLIDDVRGLPVWPRLAAQIACATLVVGFTGGLTRLPLPPPVNLEVGAAGQVVAMVWLVGVTNFFNFMDGVDGLAAGQASLTLAALAWVLAGHDSGALAVIALAATLAFLIRNWSPAKIFLGDTGSSFLGFLLAALPFTGTGDSRPRLVTLVAVSLALFLLDPMATLISRARQGNTIGEAHREHAYQRLIRRGEPHGRTVASLLLVGAALSVGAVAAFERPRLAWPTLTAGVLLFLVEWALARRRE